jgi:hypothetical protein
VIIGLTRSGPVTRREPEWPDKPQAHAHAPWPLFEPCPALRKLVVLADADLLAAPGDEGVTRAALLTGLLTHPYIKVLRYRDEGPAAGQPGDGGPPTGWACLLPPGGQEWRSLVYAYDSGAKTYTSVSAKVAASARDDAGSGVYRDRPPDVAAGRREQDALAADAAVAVGADLFITERPYLFGAKRIHAPAVTLCRTPDALAMIGLYLRSQGEFILWRPADGTPGLTANEWLYYQIGAVALLPELWHWSARQVAMPVPGAADALSGLNSALLLRMVRALRTRDSFHRACNLPQQRDAVRTVLMELDTLLVMLMGAVDASARFVHVLLGLQGKKQRDAGWQKQQWRSQLTGQSQPLADLFASGTPLADVLTILSRLRNTVHGQAIQATLRQKGPIRDAPITLPPENESQILASMDNLGGQAAWGAQPAAGSAVAVDPGQFVERLFPAVLGLLNTVMATTPPGLVRGQRPEPDSAHPWYNERNLLSVSWQLGL